MKSIFYLIATEKERWNGPSFGILIQNKKLTEEEMMEMARSLHQHWQLFLEPDGWREYILKSYKNGQKVKTSLKIRQIIAELLVDNGYIRDLKQTFQIIEGDDIYVYKAEKRLDVVKVYTELREINMETGKVYKEPDAPMFDDEHMVYSLWKEGKLDLEEGKDREIKMLKDYQTPYIVSTCNGSLYMRSDIKWCILLDGLIRE